MLWDPLASPPLRVAAAALACAASAGALGWLARRWGSGRWPSLAALFVGADDPLRGDLRFAAVVASAASGLSWVLALDAPLRELSPGSRLGVLALGLPLGALATCALADLIAGAEPPGAAPGEEPELTLGGRAEELARKAGFDEVSTGAIGTAVRAGQAAYGAAAVVAADPRVQAVAGAAASVAVRGGKAVLAGAASAVAEVVQPPREKAGPERRAALRALLGTALAEVEAARHRTDDDGVRDALRSMEEALAGYAELLLEDGADLDRIEGRVREVLTLARSCEDDGSDAAFRVLGLRRDARLEDARRVYRDLARIYHADVGASGVDPEKFKEISAAYDRIRARFSDQAAA